jgi:T-complex protein 1 subunit alpha
MNIFIHQCHHSSNNSESEITLERIRKILASGANVVLTTKGIDDLCLKEFVEAGAIAVRRCLKEDLRRIAKATGGQLISSLANLEGEESFEASYLGYAEEVVQERVSDDEVILVKGTKVVNSASVVLRGANDYMLDEMERALHDTLSIVKRTLESGSVVPGGGAVESALSVYLENFATTLVSFPLYLFLLPLNHFHFFRVQENNLPSPNSPRPSSPSPSNSQ